MVCRTVKVSKLSLAERADPGPVRVEIPDLREHREYPKFGPYRKRNKFLKLLNDRVWDLPTPVNLNAW